MTKADCFFTGAIVTFVLTILGLGWLTSGTTALLTKEWVCTQSESVGKPHDRHDVCIQYNKTTNPASEK